jgi:hypothetical protein
MTEIQEDTCRQSVMTSYIWLARMKSTDPVKADKIRDMQIKMEEVWTQFQELFP